MVLTGIFEPVNFRILLDLLLLGSRTRFLLEVGANIARGHSHLQELSTNPTTSEKGKDTAEVERASVS